MSIVTSKEIANTLGVAKYGFLGTFLGWLIMRVLRISKVNKVYDSQKHKSDLDFLNGLLGEFQIEYEI
ncbi:MAG: glycerol acyltransferase, partial [Flavobacteriaceae bacterium]|nr:glycerol acyltransferase [Flavobacteriaceae bacterium]